MSNDHGIRCCHGNSSFAARPWLEPIEDAARTVMKHRDGIRSWFDSHIANGLIEGINSLVQTAKAKARGYRSTPALKAITHMIASKLDLRLPRRNSGEPQINQQTKPIHVVLNKDSHFTKTARTSRRAITPHTEHL